MIPMILQDRPAWHWLGNLLPSILFFPLDLHSLGSAILIMWGHFYFMGQQAPERLKLW
jgi:hypothetical protein